jgi:hypothetical protein
MHFCVCSLARFLWRCWRRRGVNFPSRRWSVYALKCQRLPAAVARIEELYINEWATCSASHQCHLASALLDIRKSLIQIHYSNCERVRSLSNQQHFRKETYMPYDINFADLLKKFKFKRCISGILFIPSNTLYIEKYHSRTRMEK